MIHRVTYRRPGRLGDTTTAIVSGASKLATTGLSTVTAASSAGLLTLGATAAAAIPIAGAVIAVGTLVYSLFHNSLGLQQDADTTAAVNQGMTLMANNLAAWNASNKSLATQAQCLQNFDQAWQAIVNFCGQASEGSPGQRCISERQRGGKYDYFAAYRDPIANDPQAGAVDRAAAAAAAAAAQAAAVPTAVTMPAAGTQLIPSTLPPWLVPAAAILTVMAVLR